MLSSLGCLQHRGELGVRGSEKAGNLFGQRRVAGQSGKLALPEVEVTPRQSVEIGCIVAVGSHARTIADRAATAAFAGANLALSHCGIGAKVYGPK